MTASQGSKPTVSATDLKAVATEPQVSNFYKKNGWHSAWSGNAEQEFRSALDQRARHGLDRIAFLPDGGEVGEAAHEVALTQAALRYATALSRGLSDPESLHSIYTLPRPKADLSAPLAAALSRGNVREWLEGLSPQDADYSTLSQAYLRFREEASDGDPAHISSGVLHVGDSDARVPPLVRHLIDGDYLLPQPSTGIIYTQTIADAVKRLQRDFGIPEDGVVGPDTLEVLNVGSGDRARALAVALDRRRWLSRDVPATRIDVNTAAARLEYFRDGKLVDSRRVIVGKPGKETPLLLAPIYRLVANPTWTIPKSIQNGEMAGVSDAYLRSHNMIRRNGWIVQGSGPGNALGLVKFDMQDRYAIYLHDTSSRSLFERSERHLSHGCVRVENAEGFAEMIARDEGVEDKWRAAKASGSQKFVKLQHRIPVRLLYRNVFVDGDGTVAFRTDPYAWNQPIAQALGFAKGGTAKSRAEEIDLGP